MARVAVIGAGIAGLACARALAAAGHQPRLFDKSGSVGGRMATRRTAGGSFDHGAQYFTARDPDFRAAAEAWVGCGHAAPYEGHIVELKAGSPSALSRPETRYVAVPAMTSVCRALAEGLDIAFECAVTAVTPGDSGWRVSWAAGGESGFDAVLLAIPAAQALPLCTAVPALAQQVGGGGHRPCWAVMLRYAHPLPVAFDAAFIRDSPIGWSMRDASRPGRAPGERWVLHATAEWSEAHLEESPETVAPMLIRAFHEACAAGGDIAECRAHRWRYALSSGLGSGCLWDPVHRIGACGDWCADGRIEGAWLSGRRLAARVIAGGWT
jgi:hypothetical protein